MQNISAANSSNSVLVIGISQWISSIFVKPGTSTMDRLTNTRALLTMARDLEQSQPNLAAEFRNFASRS